ncbi:DivIVA domain-containing protein [Rhizomonospora bruguierae]|uniref:DivIVA domain-containing protein n=1 Tax=Rhizomonospora bruguierae TaxID=1581705 RepID=UPI0020BD6BA7|nr:DivIVA domain-containing protein [Micromonospora sp. NBRC 107566]
MTDNRIKDRVKIMLNGATSELAATEPPPMHPPSPQAPPTPPPPMLPPDPGHHPNHALQVLTLAQRTADEHINRAHQHADKIRADAQAAAEQIARDAQAHAQRVRGEADSVLGEARATAERAARDAQARVEEARRSAEQIVADARTQAEAVAATAADNAEELRQHAQRRYDDVVGGLSTKREALQQQIEALERFDREYRARLSGFMQAQLRALWVDQPQVAGEPDESELPPAPAVPLQRHRLVPVEELMDEHLDELDDEPVDEPVEERVGA